MSGEVWVRVGRCELEWEGLGMSGNPGYEWGGLGKSGKVRVRVGRSGYEWEGLG